MEGTVIFEMKRKVEQTILKSCNVFLLVLLLLSASTNGPMAVIPLVKIAYAEDINSYLDSSTRLNLSISEEPGPPPPGPPRVEIKPIINWYDFQNATGISKLNSQIDVNQEYKFCIKISSDQGWDDIEYIDINAWFDNGNDSSTYNQTEGGNLNMFLRYKNTTGTANFSLIWPDDEVTKGSFIEKVETDPNCHNLTFSFIPGYQFRYGPGDGSWNKTKNAINDIWSWNFRISVTDSGEDASGPSTTSIIDEFGVYSYTEVAIVGIPFIQGIPGENASAASSITINTRSNVNYSLSVDADTFSHKTHPTAKMPNQTLWLRGGNLTKFTNFTGSSPIYFYGSSTTFIEADDNNTTKTTDNVDFKCNIPFGQIPGVYNTTVYYQLRTQT